MSLGPPPTRASVPLCALACFALALLKKRRGQHEPRRGENDGQTHTVDKRDSETKRAKGQAAASTPSPGKSEKDGRKKKKTAKPRNDVRDAPAWLKWSDDSQTWFAVGRGAVCTMDKQVFTFQGVDGADEQQSTLAAEAILGMYVD